MKIKVLILLLALLISASFVGISIVQAATSVSLFQITTDGSQQKDPLVYNDLVAYDSLGDIWGYSLVTKENFPILQKSGQQYLTGLYEDLIVYDDFNDTTQVYSVHLYNMKTGQDTIVADSNGSNNDGVTNGKEVVYINGGACGTLNSYDIKTKVTTQIFNSTCTSIRISQGIVVFPEADSNGTNIKAYDLRKKELFDVTTENHFQESPNIYKDNVVWLDYITGARGDYNAIKMKNLHTGEEKTIYESSVDSLQSPAVSDKYAVWSQSSAPNIGGVMGANLKTGEVFEVQPQGSQQNSTTTPAIWGDTAAMMSWRTGNGDIYGATLNH